MRERLIKIITTQTLSLKKEGVENGQGNKNTGGACHLESKILLVIVRSQDRSDMFKKNNHTRLYQ